MQSMFRLVRNLSVRTWYHRSGYVNALSTIVQKQALSNSTTAGSIQTTKTSASKTSKTSISGQLNETNIRVSHERKQLDIRSPPRNNKRCSWTEEKDAVLREGIVKHKKDGWPKVAEFMGGGLNAQQCRRRAVFLEGLAQVGVKRGAWEQEELRRLEELVPQYLVHSYWSAQYKKMTDEYTDWKGVGKEIGRLPDDCSTKWRLLQSVKLKKGRFTVEEDALIRKRVAEWKGEGSGLWIALQKEMGRSADAILKRWNTLTSAFQQADKTTYWTDELDERLKEGVNKHKADGWAKVAEYMGGGVTAATCRRRWNAYLGAMQHGNAKRGAWDQDEVEKLAELVPQHLVPSYLSTRGRMTKEYTDWVKVGAKLGRLPVDCRSKWSALQYATMKTGPFTDSENAIIKQRVEGWGDKGPGLWVGLEKDLGRPSIAIRRQWINVLSKDSA